MWWIPISIVIVLLVILIISNVHIVQQSQAYVVTWLGQFHAIWNQGPHVKVPFVMRVVKKVSMKEQVADFPPQPVITKDNVTMQIDTVIYFQITDPKLYTYGVEHPMSAIENLDRPPPGGTSSATWTWNSPSPAGTSSTPGCAPSWTRPRTPGASRSTGWS